MAFKTDGLTNSAMSGIYIKRIAGLPGERIRIDPPYLIVDDKKLTIPAIFQAIASKSDGHAGFQLATLSSYTGARLVKPTDEVVLESLMSERSTWALRNSVSTPIIRNQRGGLRGT